MLVVAVTCEMVGEVALLFLVRTMSSDTSQTVGGSPPFQVFGLPWPDLNDGLFYNDSVSSSDSELRLIEFCSLKYKNSASLQGEWSIIGYVGKSQRHRTCFKFYYEDDARRTFPAANCFDTASVEGEQAGIFLESQELQLVPVNRLGRGTLGQY
ncbi:uncharacterized protein LOC119988251 [Tripterygium wilfordii]|uniref:uncharacterized protein LOC119988251 n=1 Tax=Tripterygium wilfordii TaxID=458696 RepID=UPI0018F7ECD7|nr:uncharacterized protein LOC119988251 [Tripterygium wilfordii]